MGANSCSCPRADESADAIGDADCPSVGFVTDEKDLTCPGNHTKEPLAEITNLPKIIVVSPESGKTNDSKLTAQESELPAAEPQAAVDHADLDPGNEKRDPVGSAPSDSKCSEPKVAAAEAKVSPLKGAAKKDAAEQGTANAPASAQPGDAGRTGSKDKQPERTGSKGKQPERTGSKEIQPDTGKPGADVDWVTGKAIEKKTEKTDTAKEKAPEAKKVKSAKPKKLSPLQKIAARKKEFEEKKEEMGKLVDDIVAGKFKSEGGGQPKGNMLIKMPTMADRTNTRTMILGQFRAQYAKIGKHDVVDCPSSNATSMYTAKETEGLTIKDGHQALPRPKNVALPKDFRKKITSKDGKGEISLIELGKYGADAPRKLVSVYGDVFDVSDRPDKYGVDGPYSWMSGCDLTWGFVSGKDTPDTVNRCYDLWKVAPEPFRDSKLKLIYAWVAWYEWEYGEAVAKLDLYATEGGLKGPPMEESEDCCIM